MACLIIHPPGKDTSQAARWFNAPVAWPRRENGPQVGGLGGLATFPVLGTSRESPLHRT
jgi:hypothetical protein